WLADRHLESVTAPEARPLFWLRALRFWVLTVPLIGILMSLAWYRFLNQSPRRRNRTPRRPPLVLESHRRFRFSNPLRRLDQLLRAAFQHLWVAALWLAVFQVIPFYAALDSLGVDARHGAFSQNLAGILCIFFRVIALGAFVMFVKERQG